MSQTELAARAGISRPTLNAIESGLKRGLRLSTLLRLGNALGVDPNRLTGYATLE